MIHKCEPCNFTTENKKLYEKHLLTKKHLKAVAEGTEDGDYMCENCDKCFVNLTNLSKHEKVCKNIPDQPEIQNQKDEGKKVDEPEASNQKTNSLQTFLYEVENLDQAPLNVKKQIKKKLKKFSVAQFKNFLATYEEGEFEDMILHYHKEKKLDVYMAELLTEFYEKVVLENK